jgi:hypothetical protein
MALEVGVKRLEADQGRSRSRYDPGMTRRLSVSCMARKALYPVWYVVYGRLWSSMAVVVMVSMVE